MNHKRKTPLKLYQNKETKDLCVLREVKENGDVKLKHLYSPIWETLTQEQLRENYIEITNEEDIV